MITIREIREGDAAAYVDLRARIDEETQFMLLEPGERRTSVEESRTQIQRVRERDNQTILVVEDEGRLVGYLLAMGGNARRIRHRVYVVVGLRAAYTGQGIGTRLFEELERWARARQLHRLELTVMTHNARGVALYQKMGFEIEGTKRHALLVDGEYVDEYYMAKILT